MMTQARQGDRSKLSAYVAAADPQRYRKPDACLFRCEEHGSAAVLCSTAGKVGRNGRQAAIGATLFWLTCPHINHVVAALERLGCVHAVDRFLRSSPSVMSRHCGSHAIFESRVKQLLEASDCDPGLWSFYRDHFIDCAEAGKRKYGNAAVGHPEDMKCLHALVAQELCGAANPVGAALCNFIVFMHAFVDVSAEELMLIKEEISASTLLEGFLTSAFAAGRTPASTQRIDGEVLGCEREGRGVTRRLWTHEWRSVEDLRALRSPDLCGMAAHLIAVYLEGKGRRSKKRRVN